MREQTTVTKLYTFDELSDKAKDKARDWYRSFAWEDSFWSEYVIEDADTIAELFGLDLHTRVLKTKPAQIYWSGFSSQGDGACFEGRYSYKKGSSKAVKEHAPLDTALHAIVDGLTAIQKRYLYKAGLDVSHRDNYCHSGTMRFEDIGERELNAEDFDAMRELLRDFADWIYKNLEREWDYMNADEQVDESIMANEYEFTEEGARA